MFFGIIAAAAALTAAFFGTLPGIRTADAGLAALFGLIQIQYNAADDTQKNYNQD